MNVLLDRDVSFLVEYSKNIYKEMSSLHTTSHQYYPVRWYDYHHYFHPHFIDEETKTQREEMICPFAHWLFPKLLCADQSLCRDKGPYPTVVNMWLREA